MSRRRPYAVAGGSKALATTAGSATIDWKSMLQSMVVAAGKDDKHCWLSCGRESRRLEDGCLLEATGGACASPACLSYRCGLCGDMTLPRASRRLPWSS